MPSRRSSARPPGVPASTMRGVRSGTTNYRPAPPAGRSEGIMQIAIGTYDHTRALKDGTVRLPDVSIDFVEVSPITRAFRHMATQQAYDVSEMALATYFLARVYDKPIVGLPIV